MLSMLPNQNRHNVILEAAIREFIQTGEPVSSAGLFKKYGFGVRPATIRNELNLLTDQGFLMQPHTSAGRVPTDHGYQFWVERILEQEMKFEAREQSVNLNNLADFVEEIAKEIRLLSVGYEEEKEVYKSGLDELFRRLDFVDKQEAYEVASDFEHLDERIDKIFEYLTAGTPKVFIGKSPITRSPHLSVVAELVEDDGERAVFLAIGPKRMNYEKVIKILRNIG